MGSLIIHWAGEAEPVVFTVSETVVPLQTGIATIDIPGVGLVKGHAVYLGNNLNPFTNQIEHAARFHATIVNPEVDISE